MKVFSKLILSSAILGLVVGCTSTGSNNTIDERLVGTFEGQRDVKRVSAKCPFTAWTFIRSADGRFNVTFYSDPAKTRIQNKERGTWWVENDKLFILTQGVTKPDIYQFKFRGKTIDYTLDKAGIVDGCVGDYRFSDQRR